MRPVRTHTQLRYSTDAYCYDGQPSWSAYRWAALTSLLLHELLIASDVPESLVPKRYTVAALLACNTLLSPTCKSIATPVAGSISISLCIGREASFGHGILRVAANGTTMSWEWHRNQDGVPVVTDSVTLVRDTKACPARGAQAKPAMLAPSHPPTDCIIAHV